MKRVSESPETGHYLLIVGSGSRISFSTISRWDAVRVDRAGLDGFEEFVCRAASSREQALGGGNHVVGHAGIGLDHRNGDARVVIAGESIQSGGLECVVGRLADETKHRRNCRGKSNFAESLDHLEPLARSARVGQNAEGVGDRLRFTRRTPNVIEFTAKFREGIDQLGRQFRERPAGVG